MITEATLSDIRDRASLFGFLKDELNWPLDPSDTFTYDEPGLGSGKKAVQVSRLVPFSADDPFSIFLTEFDGGFSRTELRYLLNQVRRQVRQRGVNNGHSLNDTIFLCPIVENGRSSYATYKGMRFAHLEQRTLRETAVGTPSSRLRVFGFDRETIPETRTLREMNLPALHLETDSFGKPDWTSCKDKWLDAWSVEKVTREFFRAYKSVFEDVRDNHLEGVIGDKHLFTQRLFNRLLFLHFLDKKGWLRAPNGKSGNYLRQLWEGRRKDQSFYEFHIAPLFFLALNQPYISRDNLLLNAAVGQAPYLNGGLFHQEDNDLKGERVDDAAFEKVLCRLLEPYNFTVTEATVDDADVAIDPEALGQIFEELATGRHEKGAYYTPRPIVAFMCREALKGYLAERTDECIATIASFVDEHNSEGVENPEAVYTALKKFTCVDPACGSGAYLLGMLQELMALRQALFATRQIGAAALYDRKLEIIQNSIYGVDKDPFAVNIARLRLWLSLVVDSDLHPLDNPDDAERVALPNLDFKIEAGDSLAAPDPASVSQTLSGEEYRKDAICLKALYAEYGRTRSRPGEPLRPKAEVARDIGAMRRRIAALFGSDVQEGVFDWRVFCAHLFVETHSESDGFGGLNLGLSLAPPPEPGGFDAVLANPPYIRAGLITAQKPALKKAFPEVYDGNGDLYCYFYARAVQLLKPRGVLAFISSNKWFRAGYGVKLKKYIAETCTVQSITDFGELPVFEAAATFPMIFIARRGGKSTKTLFTQVKNLSTPYPDIKMLIAMNGKALPIDAFKGSDWVLADSETADRLSIMESAGPSLRNYVCGKIFYGVKTGLNEVQIDVGGNVYTKGDVRLKDKRNLPKGLYRRGVFVIDRKTRDALIDADPKSAEILKPLATGDDIRRWHLSEAINNQYLVYSPWELDIEKYPAIKDHLSPVRTALESRPECRDKKYSWWCMARYGAEYAHEYSKPKIVYPVIGKEPRFTLDETGAFTNDKAYIIASSDKYLLGVLNSTSVWEYLKRKCSSIGDEDEGGRLELRSIYMANLPIPEATDVEKSAISALVQQCLDARGVGVEDIEAQINERVAALYGL